MAELNRFRRTTITFLFLVLLIPRALADPENFVVAGFTFDRPSAWKWVWDEKRSRIGNLLEVRDDRTKATAPVYFWKFSAVEGSFESRTKAWQEFFHEAREDLNVQCSTNAVGDYKIIYVEMEGTSARVPHGDFALIGAIIPLKEGNLAIRMSGRSTLVQDAKIAFRKMIDTSVKGRDSE
jgi:hypothetical protein